MIIEEQKIDFLLGLDMLRRFQVRNGIYILKVIIAIKSNVVALVKLVVITRLITSTSALIRMN